jgi:Ca2+-binding RTX toxin-like protein
MLWLAGLMGLMAVGAVTFIDPQSNTDEDDDVVDPSQRLTEQDVARIEGEYLVLVAPQSEQADGDLTELSPLEDNFEPDYDPRGGDDAAILQPYSLEEADRVTLTDGSDDDDAVDGGDGNDRIRGNDGADTLGGGSGNDELRGDAGDDVMSGDAGNDTLHGHDGRDELRGGDEDDELFGHNSDDVIWGDAGDDMLQGSAGNDILDGGGGNDSLQGGLDDDTLTGGMGADVLFGGWGNDLLNGLMRDAQGNDGDTGDFLNGGGGDDTILAGSGDVVTAGDGADQIVLGDWLGSAGTAQIMDYTAGDDSIVLLWDDSATDSTEPLVTLSVDTGAANHTQVMMDGLLVATVNGTDLVAGDIALIPLSSASSLGFAFA